MPEPARGRVRSAVLTRRATTPQPIGADAGRGAIPRADSGHAPRSDPEFPLTHSVPRGEFGFSRPWREFRRTRAAEVSECGAIRDEPVAGSGGRADRGAPAHGGGGRAT